jgi:hypothetical protein
LHKRTTAPPKNPPTKRLPIPQCIPPRTKHTPMHRNNHRTQYTHPPCRRNPANPKDNHTTQHTNISHKNTPLVVQKPQLGGTCAPVPTAVCRKKSKTAVCRHPDHTTLKQAHRTLRPYVAVGSVCCSVPRKCDTIRHAAEPGRMKHSAPDHSVCAREFPALDKTHHWYLFLCFCM